MTEPRTDDEIVRLYREWSEIYWAAGFTEPDAQAVQDFRRWLPGRPERRRSVYEQRMLDEYHRQEAEEEILAKYRRQEAEEQDGG